MSIKRIPFFEVIHTFLMRYVLHKRKSDYGHIGKNSFVHTPSICGYGQHNIYLGDNCTIDWNNVLYCDSAKFIMKDNSGAAVGLTVVTGNHSRAAGIKRVIGEENDNLVGKDIVVDEDVWIASNVTLLAGAHIGRGAIVGAGSVIRNCKVPPYAIVMGNPAKVVSFRYTIEEILKHEEALYKAEDRIPREVLEKNYDKYYTRRMKEILDFVKL